MTIAARCRECGKRYDVRDEFAGRSVPCKHCGAMFRVPSPRIDDFELEEVPVRPKRSRGADDDYDNYRPRNRAVRRPRSSNGSKGLLIGLSAVVGVGVLGIAGYFVYSSIGKTAAAVPAFPELPPAKIHPASQAKIHFVDLGTLAKNGDGPGKRMKMRVYLPAGEHAAKSLGCVLVAPAGTRLIHGNDMDDDDYHKETLPYVRAGYAVVFYSIDGPVSDNPGDAEAARAYKQFKAAQAGVVNGRNALEFVLAKVPQVDPARIYSAGHSSAAVLSLLLAVREPRIKAAIAYAPATDVETRLKDLANDPGSQRLLPGLKDFLRESSPLTHVDKYRCPLFVFHARDDSNEPFRTTEKFVAKLKEHGKNVTFSIADRGDHYQSMVREGIPRAIAWLNSQPGEVGKHQPGGNPPLSPNTRQPPPRTAQNPPSSNNPPPGTINRPPTGRSGSRIGRPTFPRTGMFPRNRTRGGMPARSGVVMTFDVKAFNGRGTPEAAARKALGRVALVEKATIRYDASANKISFRTRTRSLSTVIPRTMLLQEGFVIGAVSVSSR